MKLLLVGATKAELAQVFEHFNLPTASFVQSVGFDILLTGVGMTATAFALGQHLTKGYDLVLNVGIAGSFKQDIPLGSLVNIVKDTFAELGAEDHEDFLTIDDLGFGTNTYNSSYEIADLTKAKSITVNKVHGNAKNIMAIQERFDPQTESMEGAAVFYACERLGIPCAQVRSISNYITPREKESWRIGLAIDSLNKWVISFLTSRIG